MKPETIKVVCTCHAGRTGWDGIKQRSITFFPPGESLAVGMSFNNFAGLFWCIRYSFKLIEWYKCHCRSPMSLDKDIDMDCVMQIIMPVCQKGRNTCRFWSDTGWRLTVWPIKFLHLPSGKLFGKRLQATGIFRATSWKPPGIEAEDLLQQAATRERARWLLSCYEYKFCIFSTGTENTSINL